jgi:O-acetyl-ADP-ribose deacetylase
MTTPPATPRPIAWEHQSVPNIESRAKGTIELVLGDLVNEDVMAIIAPVGAGDAGVSRAQLSVHRAAGPGLAKEYEERVARLPGGIIAPLEHIVTSGHSLRAKYVVHCRLLEASQAQDNAEAALATCLRRAFETCRSLGVDSIALPALGTGAYGYRTSAVAKVSMRCAVAAQRHSAGPARIRFLLAGPATLETFLQALSATE